MTHKTNSLLFLLITLNSIAFSQDTKKSKLEVSCLTPDEAREDSQHWQSLSNTTKQDIIDAFSNDNSFVDEQLYWFYVLSKEKRTDWSTTNAIDEKLLIIDYLAIGTNLSNTIVINNKLIGPEYFKKQEEKYVNRLLDELTKNYSTLSEEKQKKFMNISKFYETEKNHLARMQLLPKKNLKKLKLENL
jgi:hypothetical protein